MAGDVGERQCPQELPILHDQARAHCRTHRARLSHSTDMSGSSRQRGHRDLHGRCLLQVSPLRDGANDVVNRQGAHQSRVLVQSGTGSQLFSHTTCAAAVTVVSEGRRGDPVLIASRTRPSMRAYSYSFTTRTAPSGAASTHR